MGSSACDGHLSNRNLSLNRRENGFAIDTTKPTILTINPAFQQSIGAQELPTFDDIVMLNLHYSCYGRATDIGTEVPEE
uniref:Astacin domain-containing protein n=1 Tax=Steinernema glaseri TaxID=37863 RepID=A0A1I8A6B6_9BILA